MSRRWQRAAVVVFVLVAAGFLVAALAGRWEQLRGLEAEVRAYPWRLRPGWLAAALGLCVASLVGTGAAWARLFRESGGSLDARTGAAAWLVSNLGRYIPGKVWQLSGLALMVRRRGESGTAAVATSVVLQAVTVLTGMAFALAAVAPTGEPAGRLAPLRLGLLVVGLALLVHPRVVRLATGLVARWTGDEAVRVEVGGRELLAAAGALSAAWIGYGLGFWCLLRGLVPAPPGPIAATGVFAASYVAGYLVLVSPGGLVAREGAMAALLVAVAGFPLGVATGLAVAARLWVTAGELVALGLGAWWLREGPGGPAAAGGRP